MAEERPKAKSLKLKRESGGSELLKSAVRRSSSEKGTPDRKEQGNSLSKGKESLTPGSSKDPLRTSSFGKNLVKVAKEFAKSSEGKVSLKQESRASEAKSPIKISSKTSTKVGASVKDEVRAPSKKEGRVSVNNEAKSPIKISSKTTTKAGASVKDEVRSPSKKEGRVSVKDETKSPIKVLSKTLMKEKGSANGKEQGKSVIRKEHGKDVGKANGKSSAGVRPKDEVGRDVDREKVKAKTPLAKNSLTKTPTKSEQALKSSPKSITKAGASPSVVQSVKRKVTKTVTTVTATKTVTEQKKEKKVYDLPGQKHDPPEERDALRIFYSTLREQMPESEMAEIWLMEYGLLPLDEAQKAFERKQKRTQTFKLGGPSIKAVTPTRMSNGSPGVKKSTPVSNGKAKVVSKLKVDSKAKDVSKAKKKRVSDSENDSDYDTLFMAKSKKKLKT